MKNKKDQSNKKKDLEKQIDRLILAKYLVLNEIFKVQDKKKK